MIILLREILPVDVELEFVAGNVVGSASEPIELKAGRVFISVNGQGKGIFRHSYHKLGSSGNYSVYGNRCIH